MAGWLVAVAVGQPTNWRLRLCSCAATAAMLGGERWEAGWHWLALVASILGKGQCASQAPACLARFLRGWGVTQQHLCIYQRGAGWLQVDMLLDAGIKQAGCTPGAAARRLAVAVGCAANADRPQLTNCQQLDAGARS